MSRAPLFILTGLFIPDKKKLKVIFMKDFCQEIQDLLPFITCVIVYEGEELIDVLIDYLTVQDILTHFKFLNK